MSTVLKFSEIFRGGFVSRRGRKGRRVFFVSIISLHPQRETKIFVPCDEKEACPRL